MKGTVSPPDSELLTVLDVAALFKISQKSVWRWVDRGWLPQPLRFNRWVVRWRRRDVQEMLDKKMA